MTEENFSPVRLTAVVINKFRHFNYVKLKFTKFTSINGKAQSAEALASLVEALKFVLDCGELSLDQLQHNFNHVNLRSKEENVTFVEATIKDSSDTILIFRKSIINNKVVYTINNEPKSQNEYKKCLLSTQILLPTLNTLVLDSRGVDKVSSRTDAQRAALIEFFCGSEKDLTAYENLSHQLSKTSLVLDAAVKQQKELTLEKKKIKKSFEATEELSGLKRDLAKQSTQFDLFRLFHNENFIKSSGDVVKDQKLALVESKAKKDDEIKNLEESFKKLKNFDEEMWKLEDSLENMIQDSESQQKLLSKSKTRTKQLKLEEEVQQEVEKIQEEIEKNNEELKRLEKLEDLEKAEKFQEFLSLKISFEEENEEELNFLSCGAEEDRIASSVKKFSNSSEEAKTKISEIRNEIDKLKSRRDEKVAALVEHEKLQDEAELLSAKLSQLDDSLIKSRQKQEPNQKILAELKKKFPGQVIGRLFELWTSEQHENFIKSRLGQFSQAIVVDTPETAENCMKILELHRFSEVFLVLSDFSSKISSKTFLPGEKLPKSFNGDVIENLFKGKSEEVEKLLLNCLKPSLVCSSWKDAEKSLTLKGTKKLDVLASDELICFKKQGFIERGGRFETVEDDEIEQRRETRIKLIGLKKEVGKRSEEANELKKEIREIEAEMKILEDSLTFHQNCLKFDLKRLKELQKFQLDPVKERNLEVLKEKINQKEVQHFKNFGKFEEFKKKFEEISTLQTKIKFLKDEIQQWKEGKIILRLNSEDIEAEIEAEETKAVEIMTEDEKIQLAMDRKLNEVTEKQEELFEAVEESLKSLKSRDKTIQEIKENLDAIAEVQSQVLMSQKENFEILTKSLKQQKEIPLKTGTMIEFFSPPTAVTDDYELVKDQLSLIEINFDGLKKVLKENVDVDAKTLELTENLQNLSNKIDKTRAQISDQNCKQRVNQISEVLKKVNKNVTTQKTRFDGIKEKLDEVKKNRKRTFDETLDSVNETLAEFCKKVFAEKALAKLIPMNDNEPYLSDVTFTSRTVDDITFDCHGDRVASLAFLFGILNARDQQFVILNDATKNIVRNLQEFFESYNTIQIISFTSSLHDDTANYFIRKKLRTFSVVENN